MTQQVKKWISIQKLWQKQQVQALGLEEPVFEGQGEASRRWWEAQTSKLPTQSVAPSSLELQPQASALVKLSECLLLTHQVS